MADEAAISAKNGRRTPARKFARPRPITWAMPFPAPVSSSVDGHARRMPAPAPLAPVAVARIAAATATVLFLAALLGR